MSPGVWRVGWAKSGSITLSLSVEGTTMHTTLDVSAACNLITALCQAVRYALGGAPGGN